MKHAEGQIDFKVIGTTPERPDGIEKVTGRARFADDIYLPRMLFGKILRSPHAHAIIKNIDTSKARALPGVHGVLTGGDFPQLESTVIPHGGASTIDIRDLAENCIARDKTLYDGHAVAAAVADNYHIAEQALELIEVDYEILEPVLEIEDALKDDAPVLHETFSPGRFILQTEKSHSNAGSFKLKLGDADRAFQNADHVLEENFQTRCLHQGYIEPHSVTVEWSHNDIMSVWTSTQGHFAIREQLAFILRHPLNKVKVTPMEIGGGFGGKDQVYIEPIAAMFAKKTGRPVKIAMSRADMLRGTGPSPGANIRVKLAAKKDGTLLGADLTLAYEAGAYPGGPVTSAALQATARYNIPDQQILGHDVLLNKPKMKQYRAPGGLPVNFAMESMLDILARKLELDPLELRLTNAMVTGDRMITGIPCQKIGGKELLKAVQTHPHFTSPLTGRNPGRGLAYAMWFGAGMTSSAVLTANPDGSVKLSVGTPDLSGTRMTLAMQAAEALGIAVSSISVSIPDTDSIAFSFMAVGSRTTHSTGLAVYEAAQQLLRQMTERAALYWDVDETDVTFSDGVFNHQKDSTLTLTFTEMAHLLEKLGGPITVQSSVTPKSNGAQLTAHLVDIDVDTETGKIEIQRYTAFQDVGKAIHPDYVSGQMQGGVAQGVGWALSEAYQYDEAGHLLNTTLLDYRMPTSLDLPDIETVILETPNPNHPFGVRGVGESSIMPPAGALANALYDAVGIRMTALPMTPGAVLEKLKKKQRGS